MYVQFQASNRRKYALQCVYSFRTSSEFQKRMNQPSYCQHMMEPNTSAPLAKEHWFVQNAKQCRWLPGRLQVSLTG